MTKEDFISIVTFDLPKPPSYFFYDVGLNRNGYSGLDDANINNYEKVQPNELNNFLK